MTVVLSSDTRVWLYPATSDGLPNGNWTAFSCDYLRSAVIRTLQSNSPAMAKQLASTPELIANVLKSLDTQQGFAILEGVTRPVWILPNQRIQLSGGKQFRTESVVVRDSIS